MTPQQTLSALMDAATSLVDFPGRAGGRGLSYEDGLDNIGFILSAYQRAFDCKPPAYRGGDLDGWVSRNFQRIPLAIAGAGDIIGFHPNKPIHCGQIEHLAIMVGDNAIIHSYQREFMGSKISGFCAVVESYYEPYWKPLAAKAWRIDSDVVAFVAPSPVSEKMEMVA